MEFLALNFYSFNELKSFYSFFPSASITFLKRLGQSFFSWDWPYHDIDILSRTPVLTWTPANAWVYSSRRRRTQEQLLIDEPSGSDILALSENPVKARPLRVADSFPLAQEPKNSCCCSKHFYRQNAYIFIRIPMILGPRESYFLHRPKPNQFISDETIQSIPFSPEKQFHSCGFGSLEFPLLPG